MKSFLSTVSALAIGAILPLGLSLASANAAVYDWSYTAPDPSLGGAYFTGSGTIETGSASSGGFEVTGITGTLNGSAITGLLGVGTYFGNDNLLFPTSTASFIDGSGLAFADAAGDQVNIFGFYSPTSIDVTPGNNYGQFSTDGFGVGVFSMTAAAVPEPVSLSLLASGLFGLGMIRRRRA